MASHIELNPATHLTVGTVGKPGQRVFYIQGGRGSDLISLIVEKQQANMLAISFESLLEELAEQYPGDPRDNQEQILTDLRLREPIEPLFRVGSMGLGYNEDTKRIVLVAYELSEDEDQANIVSFWVSHSQVETLIPHIHDIVSAGRPICGNCGQPMDAGGHFCPHRNGHRK